jgi:hypothetical protein
MSDAKIKSNAPVASVSKKHASVEAKIQKEHREGSSSSATQRAAATPAPVSKKRALPPVEEEVEEVPVSIGGTIGTVGVKQNETSFTGFTPIQAMLSVNVTTAARWSAKNDYLLCGVALRRHAVKDGTKSNKSFFMNMMIPIKLGSMFIPSPDTVNLPAGSFLTVSGTLDLSPMINEQKNPALFVTQIFNWSLKKTDGDTLPPSIEAYQATSDGSDDIMS